MTTNPHTERERGLRQQLVASSEISQAELRTKYEDGMSISEIALYAKKSYAATSKALLSSGLTLRSKEEGTRLYIKRHPEWSSRFVKYHIDKSAAVTDDKIALLAMIITEGYVDRTSVGFTNSQESLHSEFKKLMSDVYGSVRVGKSGILSRVSSTEIAEDMRGMMSGKSFNDSIFRSLLKSEQIAARVLRIVANTEGSMLVSIKRAPRNYTVEPRLVLANTNVRFGKQISTLLAIFSIDSRLSGDGVIVNRKEDVRRFIRAIGFSPGVQVVRKKAGLSSWYGKEKYLLSKLTLRVYAEQEKARASGVRGCFVSCKTRADVMAKLTKWYDEISGGER